MRTFGWSFILLTSAFLLGWHSRHPPFKPNQSTLEHTVKTNHPSFSEMIKAVTERKVIPFSSQNLADTTLSKLLAQIGDEMCVEFTQKDSPTKGLRRINEASRFFEERLREKIDSHSQFSCTFPQDTTGRVWRSGYPDLHIIHNHTQKHFYLDPKLYEDGSEGSSLRTFYFSASSKRMKVQHDATHLILGIRHDGNDGDWQFLGWKLVDLHTLSLKLKSEYNASNADLYQEGRLILESQTIFSDPKK